MAEVLKLEGTVHRFPLRGTREELENYGLRYLQTDKFGEGDKRKIEYMVYQDKTKMIVWKRENSNELFKIHTEAEITKRY